MRDVDKVEAVLGKKIDEIDKLEENIERYYATIETEQRELQEQLSRQRLAVKVRRGLQGTGLTSLQVLPPRAASLHAPAVLLPRGISPHSLATPP